MLYRGKLLPLDRVRKTMPNILLFGVPFLDYMVCFSKSIWFYYSLVLCLRLHTNHRVGFENCQISWAIPFNWLNLWVWLFYRRLISFITLWFSLIFPQRLSYFRSGSIFFYLHGCGYGYGYICVYELGLTVTVDYLEYTDYNI